MLKPISRLRSICKGNLNHNTNNSPTYHSTSHTVILSRISKQVLHSIPVLSIFALLGITGYTIISPGNLSDLANLLSNVDGEVHAADSTSNTSSLIIDNGTATDSTATVRNGVAYSSHTVQVSANNINGYSLKITGPTNMTTANTSNPTTITGANNKTPANMANNTWGYAWGSTSTANTSLSYNSFTGNDQTLASNSSATSANFTNKLVFAVKFGDNAVSGHYRANVKLNLTVTPNTLIQYNVVYNGNGNTGGNAPATQTTISASPTYEFIASANSGNLTKTGYTFLGWAETSTATSATYTAGSSKISLTATKPNKTLYAVWKGSGTWDTITKMQEMTADICKSAPTGTSKTLIDDRGTEPYRKSYTIQKLNDGNCWMTQNLALDLSDVNLTPADSDIASPYDANTAERKSSKFGNADTAQQWSTGSTIYGSYYSWCAATAGTCYNAKSDNADATGSICPRGWHLPKGGTNVATTPNRYVVDFTTMTSNDFAYLRNQETGDTGTGPTSWPSNKVFGGSPAYFTLGGTNWYRAGKVDNSGNDNLGYEAAYWSRTSSSSSGAYSLYYSTDSKLYPATNYTRYVGQSVRCVAYSS